SLGEYLAGYGLAQAVPVSLFTLSSYLGTMIEGLSGEVLPTIAIFLPSFYFIIDSLPFISEYRQTASSLHASEGVNVLVVGILLVVFYVPVIKCSIICASVFSLAMLLFALLNKWKFPAWSIVIIGVTFGYVLNLLGFYKTCSLLILISVKNTFFLGKLLFRKLTI